MSLNLDRYLQARASGASVALACEQSGIGAGEAELWERDIASGEVELPHVRTPAPAPAREDQPMEGEVAEGTVAASELRLLIERIERLEEERKGMADDISDVFKEAKSRGFDKPTMKRIIKLRKMDGEARAEAEALLETYLAALGSDPVFAPVALGLAA